MPLVNAASWITAKRLRVHGLLLALCLWSVYTWNVATPGLFDRAGNLKGTDFLHFYTLGSLALAHRGADLYNLEAQSQLAAQRVPAAAGIRYLPVYPPQVSILFAPFARLSYPCALILWLTLSALIYGVCVYALWRICPNLRNYPLTVLILALAFPGLLAPDRLGTNLRPGSRLLHPGLLRPARAARTPRRLGPGMPHLQAPTGPCGRSNLRRHAPLESNRRRTALSFGATGYRLDLLRPRFSPRLDPNAFPPLQPAPAARTKALPNSLPAHFLDHAPPVAKPCPRPLYPHGAAHSSPRRPLLAKQPVLASALFRRAVGHRSRRSASHGLRSGRSRARVPAPHRLDSRSTQAINHVMSRTPALSGVRPPAPRPASPLDAPPAHRSRHAGYPLCDISTR